MADYLIRALAYNSQVRAFAINGTALVNKAVSIHSLNPVAAIALGRGLMGTAMLNYMQKDKKVVTTMQIVGEGPMKGLVCIADKNGTIKGYIKNNDYESYGLDGQFGVGACLGKGVLSIINDLGLKNPYIGMIPLQSGEIGDDLAYYFTTSEQTPSLVALGVKLLPNQQVSLAAGIIIQLLPGADEKIITSIEQQIVNMKSATELLKKTKSPEGMIRALMSNTKIVITDRIEMRYKCNCSEEKMLKGILSIGKKAVIEIIDEQEVIETRCHFCQQKYHFTREKLKKSLKE